MLVFVAEASDTLAGDKSTLCGIDRELAEALAARWSTELSERVAYVVALDGPHRVGHRVYENGQIQREEGEY